MLDVVKARADPQAQNESTPIISLKPREEWPEGWTQDDIAENMREVLEASLPGVQIVMAQPISDRVDELLTGVGLMWPSRYSARI